MCDQSINYVPATQSICPFGPPRCIKSGRRSPIGDFPEERAETLFRVADDGIGFEPQSPHPGHYGLVGLREQAQLIDARLLIVSEPEQGARLTVTMRLMPARMRWGQNATGNARPRRFRIRKRRNPLPCRCRFFGFRRHEAGSKNSNTRGGT
jgi:hypothetical protein